MAPSVSKRSKSIASGRAPRQRVGAAADQGSDSFSVDDADAGIRVVSSSTGCREPAPRPMVGKRQSMKKAPRGAATSEFFYIISPSIS